MTVATEPASPQTKSTATGRMKALVYHGPGKRAWEETPRPAIQTNGRFTAAIRTPRKSCSTVSVITRSASGCRGSACRA